MFCPNCGNKLNGDEQFCNNCGTRLLNDVEQINDNSNSTNETMSEMISRKSDSFLKPIISNCKSFINRYKKQLLILASCFIIFIIGVLLFGKFYGFEKLSWDEKYEILKVDHVLNSKIKLGIIFNNKEELKNLKYSSSCGEVKNKDLTIDWDLTEAEGDCEISVSYKLRKIKKKFKVVTDEKDLKKLALEYKIDYDSEEDLDLDGLTNKQEKEYKTNAVLSDTDMDGLDDKYEILTSKTDPLKKDSDNDGLNDYDEIELGLNPLKADSKDDGVKDGSRTLTYNYTTDNLNVSITGTGNIASTLAEVTSNTKISNKEGMIDNLYTFYTEGKMTEAIVTIGYTDEELIELGLIEDNLSIYYYNEKDSKYEKIETTIDKVNNTLTAVLKHFSNYVVGDSSLVKETITNQVLFVLDNSWSMYTNEQYKEITGKEYYGGIFSSSELDGFDAEGVRFTLTSDLITKLSSKNYKIGLSEFRRDYANALEIGSDSKSLKSKLNAMNGSFITNSEGTNITNALNNSIDEFVDDSDNKYIVILTDGQDSSLKSNTQSIIKKAIENNVKICSIGFGGGSYNAELSNISNSTGCKFYSSGNSQGLTELFDNVGAELNDNLIDTDKDGKHDGILIADSGFLVNRDGFSFENYSSNFTGGHCYGMATFAQLYYKKVLPLTLSSKKTEKANSFSYDLNETYFENYSNLYDYKLESEELKYAFSRTFKEFIPADLFALENTKYGINKKYKSEIDGFNLYDYDEYKTTLTKKEQQKKYGFTYETAEDLLLNENKMQKSNSLSNNELQLFNAIYASHIRQNVITNYSSGMNLILWLRNVVGTETSENKGAQGFIKVLKQRLDDKDAPVISSDYGDGPHAINAISLVQDIENPNYYYIGVYDNNYPGEKRYVDIKCSKYTCVTVDNEYYSKKGEPIRISRSLDYDLEYYNN